MKVSDKETGGSGEMSSFEKNQKEPAEIREKMQNIEKIMEKSLIFLCALFYKSASINNNCRKKSGEGASKAYLEPSRTSMVNLFCENT